MARPKKTRIVNGITLPANLYPDARGREGYWRYRRPDKTYKTFQATLEKAVELATMSTSSNGKRPPPLLPEMPLKDTLLNIFHTEKVLTRAFQRKTPGQLDAATWGNLLENSAERL